MIKSIFLILLAILPTILILTYIYNKDKHKESKSILLKLFCLGILSSTVVILLSQILNRIFPFMSKEYYQMTYLELFFSVFIGIAFIEELCKWFVTYITGYRNREFDETYDIIIYAIFASLGFATFENILYVLENNTILLAVQRAIFSIPAHTSYAIFMSYYLCLAKVNEIKKEKTKFATNIIKSIIIPTIFHGIFDFCLYADKYLYLVIFYAFSIILFLIAFQRLKIIYKANASLFDIKH